MSKQLGYPEFMMRVKLPSSGEYHSRPSGDTAYEEALRRALMEVKPEGFEIIYPKLNEKWPIDSEGFTWVRLYCTNDKDALGYWMKEARFLQQKLDRIKKAVG